MREQVLDSLADPISAVLKKKPKDNASPQDVERHNELQRSAMAKRSPATSLAHEGNGGDRDGRDRRADQREPAVPKGSSVTPFDEKENMDPVPKAPTRARRSTPRYSRD